MRPARTARPDGAAAAAPRRAPAAGLLVGARAVLRAAAGGGELARVHLADDAPESVVRPLRDLAAARGIPVSVASSARLARLTGLRRPVAAVGVLKSAGPPADDPG